MLTILNDPAGITGGARHGLDRSMTLQENIERHLDAGGDCELRINGQIVDPLTDPRLDAPPLAGDLVTVLRRPRGAELGVYALVAVGVLAVYTYTNMPKPPGQEAAAKDSPNNKLTGQSNVARAYQAVPDVYGYRRVWPDLIQPSTTEYVANIKYVTEWLCISRGKGSISDVQYAETPIGDISGSSYEVFEPMPVGGYPELGSTTLNDVFETFASDDVNGQELPYAITFAVLTKTGTFNAALAATSFTVTIPDGPDLAQLKSLVPSGTAGVAFDYGVGPTHFSQTCTVLAVLVSGGNATFTFSSSAWGAAASGSATFTITPNGTALTTIGPFTLPVSSDRIWWSINYLRGLQADVTIRAEWWKVDGSGVEIAGTRQQQDNTYSARTYDPQFFTTKVTPAAGNGRYRIQFTRLTTQQNSSGADTAKLEEVYATRYYPTKVLPGVTIIRVTTKATLSATGFSDRKFNLRWLRHLRTLTSDTLSPSRNFARAIAHIWTLAGNSVDELDVDAYLDINTQMGEDSPLLRFDGSLDDADMSLGERMQLAANMARCMIWRDGTKWTVTRDQARSTPELQLDYRNLAAGGESGITYSAHLPASNDGVEIEYIDEPTQSKKSYVRLNISSGTPVDGQSGNPLKIKLTGCATLAQAANRAQLEARRLLYQRESVTDTALADAMLLGLGVLVRWVDPNDFGGDDGLQAGEVLAVVDDLITTSEPLDWKGQTSGRILLTGADGRPLGGPIVCSQVGNAVQLATVPAGLFTASADRQLGSRYAFAVGLTEAEIEAAGLYTVTEVKPAGDGKVSIALANYDARTYAAD